MAELLPIKFFSKREEDKQRVEGNSPRELPKSLQCRLREITRLRYSQIKEPIYL